MEYTEGNLEAKLEVIGKLSDLVCIIISNQLAPPDNGGEDKGQDEGSDDTMGLVD